MLLFALTGKHYKYNIFISACCKPIMSGAGTRNKGKTLIQSKLSFTSTLQPNAKGKLPEATLSTDEKGIKRKFGKQNRITIPIDACSSFLVNLLVNYY